MQLKAFLPVFSLWSALEMHVVLISILGKPQQKKTVSDLGEFAAQSPSPTHQA